MDNYTSKELKIIIRKYNLHHKISNYSKQTKDELIKNINKYLSYNNGVFTSKIIEPIIYKSSFDTSIIRLKDIKKEEPKKEENEDIIKEFIKLYESKKDNERLNILARAIKARSNYQFDNAGDGYLKQIYNFYKATPKAVETVEPLEEEPKKEIPQRFIDKMKRAKEQIIEVSLRQNETYKNSSQEAIKQLEKEINDLKKLKEERKTKTAKDNVDKKIKKLLEEKKRSEDYLDEYIAQEKKLKSNKFNPRYNNYLSDSELEYYKKNKEKIDKLL